MEFVRSLPASGAAPGLAGPVVDLATANRVRVTGGRLTNELDGSTDAAAWFTRDELREVPIVELVEAGLRLIDAS